MPSRILPEVSRNNGSQSSRPNISINYLPHLSQGHTNSCQRSSRPPVSISYQRFLDIIEKAATNLGAGAKTVEGDSVSPTTRAEVKLGCLDHDGEKVELFCETCEKTLDLWKIHSW